MSLNALLFQNNLRLNAGTINLNAVAQGGNLAAPIVTNSNVVCENLNAELWSGTWNDICNVGDLLVCSNAITQTFTLLPIGIDGSVLTANSLASTGISWI